MNVNQKTFFQSILSLYENTENIITEKPKSILYGLSDILDKFDYSTEFLENINEDCVYLLDLIEYFLSENIEDTSDEVCSMVLITVLYIIYRDINDPNNEKDRDNIRYILEELKMNGVGNGIVKNISEALLTSFNVYKHVFDKKKNNILELINDKEVGPLFFMRLTKVLKKFKMPLSQFVELFKTIGTPMTQDFENELPKDDGRQIPMDNNKELTDNQDGDIVRASDFLYNSTPLKTGDLIKDHRKI